MAADNDTGRSGIRIWRAKRTPDKTDQAACPTRGQLHLTRHPETWLEIAETNNYKLCITTLLKWTIVQ